MKVNKVVVISDNDSQIQELVSAAVAVGEEVVLVYGGAKDAAVGANKAYWLGEFQGSSFINAVPAVVELVAKEQPQLVLVGNSSNGRLVAGYVAVANDVAVLSDAASLEVVEGGVVATRMVYGGAAIKTDKSTSAVNVVVLASGAFPVVELAQTAAIEEVAVAGAAVTFVEKQVKTGKTINLGLAKRVVAVGRGVPSEDLMQPINEIAEILEAGVGCTRPIAEENHWLPKETYIGVSGVMMKPNFYLGLGISGQIHHMVGINTAKTLIAINKDKNAPIFSQCDYGVIADVAEVLPKLVAKLK